MNADVLPICPISYPDEAVSSWIERIGMRYGFGNDRAIAAVVPSLASAAWGADADLDADAEFQSAPARWTGHPLQNVPARFDATNLDILWRPARLAHFPAS